MTFGLQAASVSANGFSGQVASVGVATKILQPKLAEVLQIFIA